MRAKTTEHAKLFAQRYGEDIREMREGAGLSQENIASQFGWTRDAVSKIERGITNISLFHYLQIVHFMRDFYPDHPAIELYDFLTKPRRPRR